MTAYATLSTCPHCGAQSRVEPIDRRGQTTWVCGVCNGPRIPGAAGPRVDGPLRDAKSALSARTRARAVGATIGATSIFALFVFLAVAGIAGSTMTAVIGFAIAAATFALAFRTWGRGSAAGEAATLAMEHAWEGAAEAIVRASPGGLTAAELGKLLRVGQARADVLLTSLAVHDRTRVDVGDDAEVRYSLDPHAPEDEVDAVEAEKRRR